MKYTVTEVDGNFKIVVNTPFNPNKTSITVGKDVYEAFERWLENNDNIQNVLPMLNSDEREFLLSGIPVGQFNIMFPEEDE